MSDHLVGSQLRAPGSITLLRARQVHGFSSEELHRVHQQQQYATPRQHNQHISYPTRCSSQPPAPPADCLPPHTRLKQQVYIRPAVPSRQRT